MDSEPGKKVQQKAALIILKNPVSGPTGIGDLQSPLLFFPSFAGHSFGPANKFANPRKDSSPLTQNENC